MSSLFICPTTGCADMPGVVATFFLPRAPPLAYQWTHQNPMRTTSLCVLSLAAMIHSHAAEPFTQILTSVERNIRVGNFEVTPKDLGLPANQGWSVRQKVLHGGLQEGVEVIEINNGRLTVTVIPTRGMGLLDARMGEVRLAWDSPVKEVVHPSHINLESRGGLGWLAGFGEMMVRCGLEYAGHPGKDKFINNTGDEAEMDLTLHGKIGNIPASEVEVLVEKSPPHRIRVRGRVDERMFYGPKLELWTEVWTTPGSDTFTIHDTLKNHGGYDQEFQLIYHANFGATLLEEGARFVGAVKKVTPFNDHAAKSVQTFDRYQGPTIGFVEQVYCLEPLADPQGKSRIMLRNAKGDQAVSMGFSVGELPYVTLWKNTNAKEEGYVTGLEPGTGFPHNRRVERHFGRVPKLKPGATREFSLSFTIHDTAPSVAKGTAAIAAIVANRPTEIESKPVPKPE